MKFRASPQIATGAVRRESAIDGPRSERLSEQYSLVKILGVWAAAALPMGLLAWVIGQMIISHTSHFNSVVVPGCSTGVDLNN